MSSLRQGGNRFNFDAAFALRADVRHDQSASATQGFPAPIRKADTSPDLYRDFTTSLGGPVVRDRVCGFLEAIRDPRDDDSQPGVLQDFPEDVRELDRGFRKKLTWQLAPAWQLVQSTPRRVPKVYPVDISRRSSCRFESDPATAPRRCPPLQSSPI